MRGATRKIKDYYTQIRFQSTLPVRGATGLVKALGEMGFEFQSTLPVRGATAVDLDDLREGKFQSTLPVRGATPAARLFSCRPCNFNPRSPCGERQHKYTFFKCIFMKKNLEFVIYSSLYVISCRGQQRLSTSSYKYPCEPIQILMYASASLYRISGSSGRYVCLQPKCSILSS